MDLSFLLFFGFSTLRHFPCWYVDVFLRRWWPHWTCSDRGGLLQIFRAEFLLRGGARDADLVDPSYDQEVMRLNLYILSLYTVYICILYTMIYCDIIWRSLYYHFRTLNTGVNPVIYDLIPLSCSRIQEQIPEWFTINTNNINTQIVTFICLAGEFISKSIS